MTSNYVIWPAILDSPSGISLSRNNGNQYKNKPERLQRAKFFCVYVIWWKKTGKNTESCHKSWFVDIPTWNLLLPSQHQKWWTQNWHFCGGWMNCYWKFQALRVNRLFKTLKKTSWEGGGGVWCPPPLFSPLYVQVLRWSLLTVRLRDRLWGPKK